MTGALKLHRVEVDLPSEAFSHTPWEPQQLAQELRTLWFLEQVRQRRLGFSKAAELSRIPLARFLELMGEHQLTPFDYDPEEIEQELA
jgi:predicted HTH domain antitoxin